MDKTTIVDQMKAEYSYTNHESIKTVTLHLSDYGACGGTLTVHQCPICGEIDGIRTINPECNIDLTKEPEITYETDAAGIVHSIQKPFARIADWKFSMMRGKMLYLPAKNTSTVSRPFVSERPSSPNTHMLTKIFHMNLKQLTNSKAKPVQMVSLQQTIVQFAE